MARLLHVALGPMGRTHRVSMTCMTCIVVCRRGRAVMGCQGFWPGIAIYAPFSGPVGGKTKRLTLVSNILKVALNWLCQFHLLNLSIITCVYVRVVHQALVLFRELMRSGR